MGKDPCRRKLMFGVLSADVACKQDKAAQTPSSLSQRCRTGGPCDRGVGLDMDLASFGRETRKFLEQRLCISELIAARPSQRSEERRVGKEWRSRWLSY